MAYSSVTTILFALFFPATIVTSQILYRCILCDECSASLNSTNNVTTRATSKYAGTFTSWFGLSQCNTNQTICCADIPCPS
ncbi:hypothetical protein I4U23_016136 [Adineta vaga]|nr:hypothetical protein I4U23_016136 [Adineta vaga]